MRKKAFLYVLLVIFMLVGYHKVSAADLIAKCVYYNGGDKIEINIDKKYNLDIPTNFKSTISTETYHKDIRIKYDSFMKNKKFSCSNLSKMYLTKYTTSSSSRNVNHYYIYSYKDESSTVSGAIASSKKYQLNKKESKVYEDKQDKKDNKDGWDRVCHYSDYYIKFNKTKYESNFVGQNQSLESNQDVMSDLKDNAYSCPNYLCLKNYSSHGYSVIFKRFSEEEVSGYKCILGTQYGNNKYTCGVIDTFMKNIKSYAKKKDHDQLNTEVSKYQGFCKSVLQKQDYSSSNKCVEECIQTEAKVYSIVNPDDADKTRKCNMGSRIVYFIYNILKWMKYIAPVLVIILGILDFIKALAAQEDDQMKKAQKRFITRLIAAVILFLLPLIIDYILRVFNLVNDSCNITDIF